MATRTDTFDLGALRLTSGEGRQLELGLSIESFDLGGHTYSVTTASAVAGAQATDASAAPEAQAGSLPVQIPARLDISRMTGRGYALHLAFGAALHGPCMRCLESADPEFRVDAREVSQPGDDDGDELESPYVIESILDVGAWARDALALALPATLLCQPDCPGLCPACGANLNTAGPDHHHEAGADPRWAALSELKFEEEAPGEGATSREAETSGRAQTSEIREPDVEPEGGFA